ncbi:MAG: response regulator [Caulobacter sp.]|nr:response regulator [Caulobacter sp.]
MVSNDDSTMPSGLDGSLLNAGTIFNLGKAVVMSVDDNSFSLNLTNQTLMGFGVKTRHQCASAAEAQELLRTYTVDLLIVDCDMPEMDGYDLVRWLRRSGLDPNAFTPVIMVAGHTPESKVMKARDCGANFIVARPLSPLVLLERILWVARDPRQMLQAGDYFGPDRRFRDGQAPQATGERRRDRIQAAEADAPGARDEPSTEWSAAAFKGVAQ